jgi:uncharacterized protein involved in exopolysaccharide biosynthesis/Mrp family chromosome partitioning ATPase
MTNSPQAEPVNFVTIADVYFALFRQKWLILAFTLAGLAAAAAYYYLQPPPFQSDAELMVRYVVDTRMASGPNPANDTQTTTPSDMGENILNTERFVLTSFDLAQMAAASIGPEKILAGQGGGDSLARAASLVHNNLTVEAVPKSTIIHLTFTHPDPGLVQPVLREILADYLIKHRQVHQAGGTSYDFLSQQTLSLKEQITQTEDEIRAAKTNAGVVSLEESDKTYAEQVARLEEELFQARAQLAGYQALLKSDGTNLTALINLSADKLEAYQRICERLDVLNRQQKDLVTQRGYKEGNARVLAVREEIADLKKELTDKYPALAALAISSMNSVAQPFPLAPGGIGGLLPLLTKIGILEQQLQQVATQATAADLARSKIVDLQHKKQIEDANYQYFATTLEQARLDEALGPGRISNIAEFEPPTPPYQDRVKFNKMILRLLGGGVFAGLALALLLELVIDQRVKRPVEIEVRLQLPLFLVIPRFRGRQKKAMAWKPPIPLLESSIESSGGQGGNPGVGQPQPPGGSPAGKARAGAAAFLLPYYDTLRDRLTNHFDAAHLSHRPKLVAVTSTDNGAGVSSIAAGLAESLAETAEGRVLLVRMNLEPEAGRTFVNGRPACDLEDALDAERRKDALVQKNLYVVEEISQGDKRERVLPKRFALLLSRFKAGDYDYVVFDMPPVSQTSVTARLAGLVDLTLLVVVAEKSNREVVRQAGRLLTQSKATVGVVLNQAKNYVPGLLSPDFLARK